MLQGWTSLASLQHDLEKENDRIQKDNHAQQIRIEKMRIIKPNATDQNILEDGE